MNHTISQNVVALYAEPSTDSEMVSQAVFGATVDLLETKERFSRIRCDDRYEGWVLSRWLTLVEDTSDYPATTIAPLFANIVAAPNHDAEIVTRLTVGARVVLERGPATGGYAALRMPGGRTVYTHRENLSLTFEGLVPVSSEPLRLADLAPSVRRLVDESLRERLIATAGQLVGTPYLWGGTTPFGIDCSGFTQLVYRLNGILLQRDSVLQRQDGRFAPLPSDRGLNDTAFAPGDLLFFGSDIASRVKHVGMALGDGAFIHSAGQGRGVLKTPCSDREFAEIYYCARRLLPDADYRIEAA